MQQLRSAEQKLTIFEVNRSTTEKCRDHARRNHGRIWLFGCSVADRETYFFGFRVFFFRSRFTGLGGSKPSSG